MARRLLLVPAVVVTLLVPAADGGAAPHRKKSMRAWDTAPPGQQRVADLRPVGGGDGRRMR